MGQALSDCWRSTDLALSWEQVESKYMTKPKFG